MKNPIELAHQALLARLGQIVPSNGFLSDAGTRIRHGWLQDVLAEHDLAYPLLVVQPGEYPPPLNGSGCVLANIGRRVIGVVRPDHPDTYQAELDMLYVDLIAALQVPEGLPNPWGPLGPSRVTIGSAKPFPPGEGIAAGTILIPVQLHVIINGA
ncbi:hypothetical protein [Metapseudomonas resinovorans]|uniref:hypothetical protein n=1 Tax=Metapseudomonas resinovorans TaxID=53412 RepID=UPI0003FBA1BB|nr:hypothetical protein [Pseudomonas resinovorans]